MKRLRIFSVIVLLSPLFASAPAFAYPPANWSEPITQNTRAKASHIQELKNETYEAIEDCLVPQYAWTVNGWQDPSQGQRISRGNQINVIRGALRYLYAQKLPLVIFNMPDITDPNAPVSATDINAMRGALDDPALIAVCTGGPICGNGILELGEQCDDGGIVNGDGCSSTCQNEAGPLCGNGTIDPPETCEPPGVGNCDATCQVATGGSCPGGTSLVENKCFIDVGMDEANTYSSCMAYATTIPPATCEQPPTSCAYVSGPKLRCCYDLCVPTPICGNSIIEPPETCDPPNGAECNAGCFLCGNGTIEAGEQCDDSNTANGDGCSATCQNETLPVCGNSTVEPPELCDPPDGTTCDPSCNLILGGGCVTAADCRPPGCFSSDCGGTRVFCRANGTCGGSFCFPAGTLIDTSAGQRPIEDLKAGEEVLSWDTVANTSAVSRLVEIKTRKAEKIIQLEFSNGANVSVTPEHPFYDPDKNDYREAGALKVGDKVLVLAGSGPGLAETAVLQRVSPGDGAEVMVYNLSVGGEYENFFAAGILVHNKSPQDPQDCIDAGCCPGHPGCV